MELFDFSPGSNVPETMPRDAPESVVTMNSWQFSSRPTAPYQRKFKVSLYGMRWYLNDDNSFDFTTNAQFNARALERFYERNETWNPFIFNHQHFGQLTCRFAGALTVPAGEVNSGGKIKLVEVNLIQHNPGY